MKRFFDGLNLLLMVGLVTFAVWAWSRLPAEIPTHFAMDGNPDGWAERGLASWFGLPAVALLLVGFMGFFRVFLPRHPNWVNLPDRRKLSDLPEVARGPVMEVIGGVLAMVQTELLVIFGLIQAGSFRSAMGGRSQGIMITVLLVAILSSPVLLVVFFLRLQAALDRGRELSRREEAGRSPGREPL